MWPSRGNELSVWLHLSVYPSISQFETDNLSLKCEHRLCSDGRTHKQNHSHQHPWLLSQTRAVTMWFKGFRTRDFPQELVKFKEHKKNSPVFLVSIESLRFWDKYDYNYEIFPILSNTQEWTSIIMTRKRDSHHHSSTSFSTNFVVAKTRFISNVRSFIDILRSKERITSITKDNSANLSNEKW